MIQDCTGTWHKCRALLDSDSQPNFISQNLLEALKIPRIAVKAPIMGVGRASLSTNKRVCASIKSLCNDYSIDLTFLVLDKITDNLPSYSFPIN